MRKGFIPFLILIGAFVIFGLLFGFWYITNKISNKPTPLSNEQGYIVSTDPPPLTDQAKLEETAFSLKSCSIPTAKLTTWNNQDFYTINEPDHKYIDELRKKFISSGISVDYFNKNIKLIYAGVTESKEIVSGESKTRLTIDAWFMLKTNSWVDQFTAGGGQGLPICTNSVHPYSDQSTIDQESSCDICKFYVTRIHGWINLGYINDKGDSPVSYSIHSKIWHDEKALDATFFKEISSVLSPEEAWNIAKSCVPIHFNGYSAGLSKDLTPVYVINGENSQTQSDPEIHMQARVNLSTGQLECDTHQSTVSN